MVRKIDHFLVLANFEVKFKNTKNTHVKRLKAIFCYFLCCAIVRK